MPSDTVFNVGFYQRPKRRIYVLRGFDPVATDSITHNAPVAPGVTILSGQVISLDANGQWVLGGTTGKPVYFALSDSTDTDVRSSGYLPALSVLGEFEIETAWFNTSVTYNDGDKLTYDANGLVVPVTNAATQDVVGFVSRGGAKRLNHDANGNRVYPQRENNASDDRVLTFVTKLILA